MRKTLQAILAGSALLSLSALPTLAEENSAEIHLLTESGLGKSIGAIGAETAGEGTVFHIKLAGGTLKPGPHGFHLHENGSCDAAEKDGKMVPGLAAGGHYDPEGTGKHMGPSGDGHLGDLPVLYVPTDEDGTQTFRANLVAPRVKLADVQGRAIMIHADGDNFRDEPKPLGGGGARVACGVFGE